MKTEKSFRNLRLASKGFTHRSFGLFSILMASVLGLTGFQSSSLAARLRSSSQKSLTRTSSGAVNSDTSGIDDNPGNGTPIPSDAFPYETLKKSFDESHDTISLEDIDLESFGGSTQKCVWATPESSRPSSYFLKKHQWEVFVPGKPGHGPLFPGTPDRTEVHSIFLAFSYLNVPFQQIRNFISITESPTELYSKMAYYGGFSGTPAESYVRKSGDLVTTLTITGVGSPSERHYYGYCWRQ